MNPALTSYILVGRDGAAVPLPYHTPCGRLIDGFTPPRHANSSGRVNVRGEVPQYFPHIFSLRIVTENEYMAAQTGRPPFHLFKGYAEVTLPHQLPDDQIITSIDAEYLVCETTRSITWLDPKVYGLTIVADCDLQVRA